MSRRSGADRRYDRYADIFGHPETAQSIEVGNRVLHWQFMENYQQSTERLVVEDHARKALEEAPPQSGGSARAGRSRPPPTRPLEVTVSRLQPGCDAMDDMGNRQEYRGRTLVISDRYGPREFWRGGVQVSCLCDPEHGVRCVCHARSPEPRQDRQPRPRKRRSQ